MIVHGLQEGDKIGIVCCSDGRELSNRPIIDRTEEIMREIGLVPVESPFIYRRRGLESGTPAERAKALMDMYEDESIKAIFDIGGGDLAIQLLEYLNFDVIRRSGKEFWGYSDLTVIINSIYVKTGKTSWLYQARKLAESDDRGPIRYFSEVAKGLMRAEYCGLPPKEIQFLQGNEMEGILLGGAISDVS